MDNKSDLSGEFVIKDNKPVTPAEANQPKNKAHFYSSLALHPTNITFENQEEDEDIILLIRRDIITNVPWIVAAIVLIFIPPLISHFGALFTPFFNLSMQTQIVAILFYYLIVLGFILIQFTLWYFNVGLITSRRIIDFNVFGILSKQVSETKLNLVEDVTYSQVGSIRTVFDYGDIFVQTAGTHENFEFDRAPQPARVVRIIADLIGGPR